MGVTGDTTLSSDLTVAGTTNLKDTNVDGSLSVAKDLTVTGDQTIGGTLGVTGDDAEDFGSGATTLNTLTATGATNLKNTAMAP